MILDDIIQSKKIEVEELKKNVPLDALKEEITTLPFDRRSLVKALASTSGEPRLICELKKASPSGGLLREDFDAIDLSMEFSNSGAAAISVLTESKYFQGDSSIPAIIRPTTDVPLLRKDFIIDPYQIFETVRLQTDAYLLIAAVLTDTQLKELFQIGTDNQLEALIEVHSEEELDRALTVKPNIIGINARDLKDLKVDLSIPERLIPKVPKGITIVVESGIESYSDIQRFQSLGVNAFLVGTTLMKSQDVSQKISELKGEQTA